MKFLNSIFNVKFSLWFLCIQIQAGNVEIVLKLKQGTKLNNISRNVFKIGIGCGDGSELARDCLRLSELLLYLLDLVEIDSIYWFEFWIGSISNYEIFL